MISIFCNMSRISRDVFYKEAVVGQNNGRINTLNTRMVYQSVNIMEIFISLLFL